MICRLTPIFVKINLWKKRTHSIQEYSAFQHYCSRQEYDNRYKTALSMRKITLNHGLMGQNYQQLKSKLVHNISSYNYLSSRRTFIRGM
jgi:hypothetical protein